MGQKSLQKQYDLSTPQNDTNHAQVSTRQTLRTPTFRRQKGVGATTGDMRRRNEIQKSEWHDDVANAKTALFR